MSEGKITTWDVLKFLKDFEDLANKKDFSLLENMIHKDAVFRFTDGDAVGIKAVRTAFEKTWSYGAKHERYNLAKIKVLSTDTNSASATFTFIWNGEDDGRPFDIRGRGTVVLVRDEGRLMIVHEHLSHFPKDFAVFR